MTFARGVVPQLKPIEKALAAGMQVLGAVCLVDRQMGATELLREKFGLTLDSIFRLSDLLPANDRARIATGNAAPLHQRSSLGRF